MTDQTIRLEYEGGEVRFTRPLEVDVTHEVPSGLRDRLDVGGETEHVDLDDLNELLALRNPEANP